MNKSQAGRLGGLTTAARGTGHPRPGPDAVMARFKNEADKRRYLTRLGLKRYAKSAPEDSADDARSARVPTPLRPHTGLASPETAIRLSA